MNNTTHSIDPCSLRFYPSVLSFCVLLAVVGIPGNGLILYIYTKKINIPIISFFIKVLVILNLVGTSCLLPVFMHIVLNPDTKDGLFLCSWFSFGQHFFGLNTGLLYIVIAGQRYRKICKHGQAQLKEQGAKKILLGCTLFSVVSCSPNALITTAKKQNVTVSSKEQCWTSVCYFSANERANHIATLYTSWAIFELIAIFVTLVVFYSLISKHIGLHKRTLKRMSISSRSQVKVTNPTIIFFSLTVIFLVSSAPRVLQTLYYSVVPEDPAISANIHYVHDVIIMLPFINCIVNPFVFGFTSKVFRHQLILLMRVNVKRRKPFSVPPDIRLSAESIMPMRIYS
ncbi:C-X-C chemokine receptor type 2-like [Haliotis rubra]|uniref:C-X-C chemokine receptor type 2-like n=1 Tax=Haliotis rubra TaxID=36100 RepID=UPI001EE52550|nr:C-X-C chemokine receptor type 2-like [Haliotis rubra]XP_046550931.1 C-X-C chemokine receptor type 2-like [Haliotis rubra]